MKWGAKTVSKPQRLADVEAAATNLAGEVGDFVRADAWSWREEPRGGDSDPTVEDIGLLLHRIIGPSVDEIERAIFELQAMREVVRNEGKRLRREVTDYVTMSHSAMASTKIIAEGLAHWRSAIAPAQQDAT